MKVFDIFEPNSLKLASLAFSAGFIEAASSPPIDLQYACWVSKSPVMKKLVRNIF